MLDDQRTYWREQLQGTPHLLELPTDFSRPAVHQYQSAWQTFTIAPALTSELRKLGKKHETSQFMKLFAAFSILLARLSRQNDLVIGIPAAPPEQSKQPETVAISGSASMLPVRLSFTGKSSCRDILNQAHEQVLAAYDHRAVSLEQVIEVVQPERTLSHSPLFQVTCASQRLPDISRLSTSDAVSSNASHLQATVDLALYLAEEADGIKGLLEYNANLFRPETIERWVASYQLLLASITTAPTASIAALPLLPATELEQMLTVWNQTHAPYSHSHTIHRLVEEQAARTPHALAVAAATSPDLWLTYAELNAQANRLARYLRGLGVSQEQRVGVCLERHPLLLVALLAILKFGGAYVPLDPSYPAERRAFMVQDADMQVLLTERYLLDDIPAASARVLSLDDLADELLAARRPDPESAANLDLAIAPEQLGNLIYTSGSTGIPKGVAITHRSAVVFLSWTQTVFSAEEFAGTLAATSVCFDLSLFELFAPLCAGGTALLADDALQLPTLAASLATTDVAPCLPTQPRVTLVNTVPSAMSEWLRLEGVPASVRTMNLAGEPLPPSLVQQIYQQASVERVLNLYGPSENTTYSTYAVIPPDEERIPIGRPIANTQVYLLDAVLQLVPTGVVGELYLGGAGLARGYLGRSDLTAERFIPHPFSTAPEARLYRTGDLARYWADGTLDHLGRSDQQVKLRGYRIELGEIEAALRQQSGEHDIAVVVREDIPGDKRLVAYLATGDTPSLTAAELRQHLQTLLPDYMLPSTFVFLAALPLTPNGKLDRKALPAPDFSRDMPYEAPQTPTESEIAANWQEVLGVVQIGRHDSFFQLGGHSLLATQIIARTRDAFAIELPVHTLFEAPTIAGLAEVIPAYKNTARDGQTTNIQRVPRDKSEQVVNRLRQVSDEELKTMLNALLERKALDS